MLGNRFLPESCDNFAHTLQNELGRVGRPAGVASSTARRNGDAGFCGERSAGSLLKIDLELPKSVEWPKNDPWKHALHQKYSFRNLEAGFHDGTPFA